MSSRLLNEISVVGGEYVSTVQNIVRVDIADGKRQSPWLGRGGLILKSGGEFRIEGFRLVANKSPYICRRSRSKVLHLQDDRIVVSKTPLNYCRFTNVITSGAIDHRVFIVDPNVRPKASFFGIIRGDLLFQCVVSR
jgi:hypothetical protein